MYFPFFELQVWGKRFGVSRRRLIQRFLWNIAKWAARESLTAHCSYYPNCMGRDRHYAKILARKTVKVCQKLIWCSSSTGCATDTWMVSTSSMGTIPAARAMSRISSAS